MDRSNAPAGALMIAFSSLGGFYVVRALARALSLGFSTGRWGVIHPAGSIQYYAFIAVCCIGIGLMLTCMFIGLRWMA